jgi:hypothetical protein
VKGREVESESVSQRASARESARAVVTIVRCVRRRRETHGYGVRCVRMPHLRRYTKNHLLVGGPPPPPPSPPASPPRPPPAPQPARPLINRGPRAGLEGVISLPQRRPKLEVVVARPAMSVWWGVSTLGSR